MILHAWRRVRADRFALALGVVTMAGLVVRLVYVLGFHRDTGVTGDPYFYHYGANLLVQGKGFIAPLQYVALHVRLQAADHPPLYMMFLAIPSAFGLGTTMAHMLWSACLGTATVTVTGLVGRRAGGNRAGLIAATIVAASPNLWIYDGAVLSETMAIFVGTVALLCAYRAWEQCHAQCSVTTGVPVDFASPRSPVAPTQRDHQRLLRRHYLLPEKSRNRTLHPRRTPMTSQQKSTEDLDNTSGRDHHHKPSTTLCDATLTRSRSGRSPEGVRSNPACDKGQVFGPVRTAS